MNESVSYEVIRLLEEKLGDRSQADGFCLYDFVEPDALDKLVSKSDQDVVVQFRVEDYLVVVDSGDVGVEKV